MIGSNRHAGALYVALDSAQVSAIVALKPEVNAAADREAGRPLASLVSGRWRLKERREDPCALSFTAVGYGRGDLTWHTRARAAFDVKVERAGRLLSQEVVWADADGRLTLALDVDAREPLRLRLACHD